MDYSRNASNGFVDVCIVRIESDKETATTEV